MKSLSEISVKLIAITLIVAVGIHSLNSFLNSHSHQLADGTIITHAHPYDQSSDSSPFKTHQHTAAELVFLASLIHYLPTITFILAGVLLVFWKEIKQESLIFISQFSFGNPSLRGPPTLSLWD